LNCWRPLVKMLPILLYLLASVFSGVLTIVCVGFVKFFYEDFEAARTKDAREMWAWTITGASVVTAFCCFSCLILLLKSLLALWRL